MSALMMLAMWLLSVVAGRLQWRRTRNGLRALLLILLLVIGGGLLPGVLLHSLQDDYLKRPPPDWRGNTAIVLLGGGSIPLAGQLEPTFFAYSRLLETARQYHACRQQDGARCTVIISGGDALQHGQPEAQVYQRYLQALNVSPEHIMRESASLNTWQNARYTSRMVTGQAYERVVLVSSGVHLRRSRLYFAHFGVDVLPVRSDYLSAQLSLIPLWFNFALTDFALHEWLGIGRYHLYQYLGLNPARGRAGQA